MDKMDKKVEVFGFWWQVWESLDEESKEACRKELKEDYEDGEALCTKANFLWVLDI